MVAWTKVRAEEVVRRNLVRVTCGRQRSREIC